MDGGRRSYEVRIEYGIGLLSTLWTERRANHTFGWRLRRTRPAAEPSMWFHDILRKDGSPFDPKEVEYIERLTEKEK